MTREGRRLFKEELAKIPCADWSWHPDMHTKFLEEHLTGILHRHFMLPQRSPRAAFVTQAVWNVRDKKLNAKCRFWKRRHELWRVICGAALQTWRIGTGLLPLIAKKAAVLGEMMSAAVGFSTAWIKQSICQAKKVALRGFLKELGELRSQQLQKALTQFVIGGKQREQGRKVYTNLCDGRGVLVRGREALNALWIDHLGAMEHGSAIPTAELLRSVPKLQPMEDALLSLDAIPSRMDVEDVFRKVLVRKATGLDMLPSEIFRTVPKEMSGAL